MRCPVCGETEDKVLETRTTSNGSAMRRRRVCLKCGYRFTSYERVEDKPITVIKKNGDYQHFDQLTNKSKYMGTDFRFTISYYFNNK